MTFDQLLHTDDWGEIIKRLPEQKSIEPVTRDLIQGNCYKNLGQIGKAAEHLGRASKVVKELLHKKIEHKHAATILNEAADCCIKLQQFEDAERLALQAAMLPTKKGIEANIFSNIALAAANRCQFEDAEEFLSMAANFINNKEQANEILKIKAWILLMQGKHEDALEYILSTNNLKKYIVEITTLVLVAKVEQPKNEGKLSQILDLVLKEVGKAFATYPRLNKVKTSQPIIHGNWEEAIVLQDCGFGDILCCIPLLEKLNKSIKIHVTKEQKVFLDRLPLKNITFVLENDLSLPYLPYFVIPILTHFDTQSAILTLPSNKTAPVALVTQGNRMFANDNQRSMSLEDANYLKSKFPNHKDLNFDILNPKDWNESAEALLECSSLISVDTGMAHLAGAIGLPCTTLIRKGYDWRYAGLKPYWKTQTIIKQENLTSWKSTIDKIQN
jgi:tetratricopeptide (TPR) repeat protein